MSARDRLVAAAFDLFEERGFDETTVDDVATRAGVGRTTFFRHFRAKEDAVLTDHARLLADVEAGLSREVALADRVVDSARTVLAHYLDEGERARRRYRLAASIPAVRSREAAGQRTYQRAFLHAVHSELGGDEPARLEAELLASAVVTATNHVLRRWLRQETTTPEADFDAAIARATSPWLSTGSRPPAAAGGVRPELVAAARRASPALEELLAELRRLDG